MHKRGVLFVFLLLVALVSFATEETVPQYTTAEELYNASMVGQEFPLLDDRFAWVNVYENGVFSFSVTVYNGKISERSRAQLEHPTHTIHVGAQSIDIMDAVSIRAFMAAASLIAGPIQPVISSINLGADTIGVSLPNILSMLPQLSNVPLFFEQLANIGNIRITLTLNAEQSDDEYILNGRALIDGTTHVTNAVVDVNKGSFSRQLIVPFESTGTSSVGTFEFIVPSAGVYDVVVSEVTTSVGKIPVRAQGAITISKEVLNVSKKFP